MNAQNKLQEERLRDRFWKPQYDHWRHGGWYVNTYHPRGHVDCVSRNYTDKKWRIVGKDGPGQPTYRNRDEAAYAARALALMEWDHPPCEKCKNTNERGDEYCAECGEPLTHEAWYRKTHGKPVPA
jgi:hypothetical protein